MKRRIVLGVATLACLWLAMVAAAMPYAPALRVLLGVRFDTVARPTPPAGMYDSLREAATERGIESYTISRPSLTYDAAGTSRLATTLNCEAGNYAVVLLNRSGSPVWNVDQFEEEPCATPSR